MISSIFSLKQNAQITLFRDKPQLKIIKFQWEEEIIFSCYLEGHRCESVMPLFKWRLPCETMSTELRTLEWDIAYLDYLIWVSNGQWTQFWFLLRQFFLGYSREKSKTGFFKFRESLPFLYIILNGAQNFKFIGFWYATLIG